MSGHKTCAEKMTYRSAAKARKALIGTRFAQRHGAFKGEAGPVVQGIYQCPGTDHWHLTSQPRPS